MGYLELAKSFLRKQSNAQEATPASCVEFANPVLAVAQTLGGSEKDERNEESPRTAHDSVSTAFGWQDATIRHGVTDEGRTIVARANGNGAASGTRAKSVAWETIPVHCNGRAPVSMRPGVPLPLGR